MDSVTAGSKQDRCDEISNEMKSMLIKICWNKDFIEKKIQDIQPEEAVGAAMCSQNSAVSTNPHLSCLVVTALLKSNKKQASSESSHSRDLVHPHIFPFKKNVLTFFKRKCVFFFVFFYFSYSHIPMTVNQELLLDTKRVQRECSEITLTLFGRH